MAIANRRFVVQIVQVVEDRWLSRGVKGPVRTERHYSIDAIPLSAPDAETAYERAMEWIRSGRFEDTNHDHLGNETGYFALGIHDLVEVSPDGGWDKLDLPIFSLSAVDAKGVPFIQQREHLAKNETRSR